MTPRPVVWLFTLCLVVASPAGVAASGATGGLDTAESRFVTLEPNPVAADHRGEFVAVRLGTRGDWSVSDGETTVSFPENLTGRVVLTTAPDALVDDTAGTVVRAPADFALANGGEVLTLRRGGTVVDRVQYEHAPEGERWQWNRTPRWHPVGLDPRAVHVGGPASAAVFVLPDSPTVAVDTLRDADDRLLLAGYTFTSARVTAALVAAEQRGVRVRVLVDDAPVGGMTTHQATALDRLAASGIDVSVVGGEHARYDYHHPKYAVVDDRALVLTENWKPSGVGGASSRGWGVRVDSTTTADELAEVFRTDAGGRDVTPWADFRSGRSFTETNVSDASYPRRFSPETVDAAQVRLLTAPGNAESATVGLVDNATTRVWVVQPTIGSRRHPFLRAARRAAERGVEVRILLSAAWYVEVDNRRLADALNAWADDGGYPLEVRLADPDDRFEKIHAKGLVVDDAAVVGSVNWNNNSVRENREVAVILDGTEPAAYFGNVFDADWQASTGRGGGSAPVSERVPLALLGAAVLSVAGVAVVAKRKLAFECEP